MNTNHVRAAAIAILLASSLGLGGCATTGVDGPRVAAPLEERADTGSREIASEALRTNADIAARSGEVVVVAFFATWCPAARQMLRSVAKLGRERGGRGLVVMGVSEDEDAAAATRFARSVGLEQPITLDKDGALGRVLKLETVPAIVVVGRDGTVRRVHAGYHGDSTDGALDREVTALLQAPRPAIDRDATAATEIP